MIKKKYLKPTVSVVEIQNKCQILIGSKDAYGMNNDLIEEEVVPEGW